VSSRWREENYYRYARTHFALDAYATTPDNQNRMVPSAAKKTAATRVRAVAQTVTATQADRDAALCGCAAPPRALRDPHQPGPQRPVEAAWRELANADAAVANPARVRLGDLAPDMVQLDAETKQITHHAIRMAACNAQTTWPAPSKATTPAPAMWPARSFAKPSPSPATSTPPRPAAGPARPAHRAPPHPRGQTPPQPCMNSLSSCWEP
jgi:hypothetical protein